jgi:hypothetical protein
MAAHDAPGVHLQSLLLNAEREAVHHDLFVLPADEHINPIDRGEGDEVELLLIPDFVVAAHVEVS